MGANVSQEEQGGGWASGEGSGQPQDKRVAFLAQVRERCVLVCVREGGGGERERGGEREGEREGFCCWPHHDRTLGVLFREVSSVQECPHRERERFHCSPYNIVYSR